MEPVTRHSNPWVLVLRSLEVTCSSSMRTSPGSVKSWPPKRVESEGSNPALAASPRSWVSFRWGWGFLDDWYAGVRFFFLGGGVLVEDGSKESRTPMLVRRVGNWLNLIFFGWAQLLQISYYPKRSQRWMTSSMWHVSTATFHPQNLGLGLARRQLPSGGPCPARSKESTPRVLLPCVRQRGAKGKHYTHTQVGLKLV